MHSFKDTQSRRAYSVVEAGRACGLSRSSIYKLIESGKLKTIKILGRRLVPAEALDELLRPSA
jgi:excisionase family DNA binding protein